jgi:hypothetical protein
MAFKSLAVPVLTTDTEVIVCPATMEGAAVLAISNVTGGASTVTVNVYRQATATTVTLSAALAVAANTTIKYPAPISLEAGDKIIMTAPSNSIIVAGGTFTFSAATPAAVGFTPMGEWSGLTTYDRNDVVSFTDGNSYVSRVDDNLDNQPDENTNEWMVLAEKGAPGDDGAGDVSSSLTLTAGTGLTGGGDLSTNRTFAVDKASDANMRAATSNKVVTSDLIESASALVALTDAAPVAVDWDAGVNFSLTVTAARQIGNPTNGQPGTWRTILVQGNDGTDRTITFGNQFLGAVPTITDCDNNKWYLLMIFCVTTTHFVVSKQVAKS